MTILQICAVKDRAVNSYAQPMFVPHINVSIRGFTDEVNRADSNNMLYKHPEDYELYHIGEYNDEKGVFYQSEEHPRLLTRAQDVRASD